VGIVKQQPAKLPAANPPFRRLFVPAGAELALRKTLNRLYGDTRFTIGSDHAPERPGGIEVIPHGDDREGRWLRAFWGARRRVVDRELAPTDVRIALQMQEDDPNVRGAFSEHQIERMRVIHHLPTSRD
jgi:hypothetical protein